MVLGGAYAIELGNLSMAMGAALAGVLLSEAVLPLPARALETLGVAPAEVADISARIRHRERLQLDQAGRALFSGKAAP